MGEINCTALESLSLKKNHFYHSSLQTKVHLNPRYPTTFGKQISVLSESTDEEIIYVLIYTKYISTYIHTYICTYLYVVRQKRDFLSKILYYESVIISLHHLVQIE